MKKQLFLLVMILLPMVASADAVEIDGIYYNLIQKGKGAEVTTNPNKYKGDINKTFDDLKDRVERANNISYMLGFKDKADSLRTQFSNRIDNEPENDPSTGGNGHGGIAEPGLEDPKPKKKVTINVIARNITTEWQIETEEELDDYLKQFRKQIVDRLDEHKILKIQF